jgi:SlyX protein
MDQEAVLRRLVDLEHRYMQSEKMLDDLSDVITAQQRTIDRLEAEIAAMRERFAGMSHGPNEPPPHY